MEWIGRKKIVRSCLHRVWELSCWQFVVCLGRDIRALTIHPVVVEVNTLTRLRYTRGINHGFIRNTFFLAGGPLLGVCIGFLEGRPGRCIGFREVSPSACDRIREGPDRMRVSPSSASVVVSEPVREARARAREPAPSSEPTQEADAPAGLSRSILAHLARGKDAPGQIRSIIIESFFLVQEARRRVCQHFYSGSLQPPRWIPPETTSAKPSPAGPLYSAKPTVRAAAASPSETTSPRKISSSRLPICLGRSRLRCMSFEIFFILQSCFGIAALSVLRYVFRLVGERRSCCCGGRIRIFGFRSFRILDRIERNPMLCEYRKNFIFAEMELVGTGCTGLGRGGCWLCHNELLYVIASRGVPTQGLFDCNSGWWEHRERSCPQ